MSLSGDHVTSGKRDDDFMGVFGEQLRLAFGAEVASRVLQANFSIF